MLDKLTYHIVTYIHMCCSLIYPCFVLLSLMYMAEELCWGRRFYIQLCL